MQYFCVPQNDKLSGYWDLVSDRLFKIRHCMTIEGIERQLPLFEPPIEPGLLVQAVAKGLDLRSVLSDLSVPLPQYRFNVIVQKALELCAEVKSLGATFLSVLEKKDAEELALTRAAQETQMLEQQVRRIKEQQVKEAEEALEALRRSQELATLRYRYYHSRSFMNAWEQAQLLLTGISTGLRLEASLLELVGAASAPFPDWFVGEAGYASSPVAITKEGSSNVQAEVTFASRALGILADLANTAAGMSATYGGYVRRAEEWQLQKDLAAKEELQIQKQIDAAQIRVRIAQWEQENHEQQIANAKEVETILRTKYTNQELYEWMKARLSALYFQSYHLAYDLAKKAEKAYRFERGEDNSNFIQFGYWENLRAGLLAGEQLSLALKQLERSYLDQNRREYEITKHISLAQLDPLALLLLKHEGQCFVSLPEVLFDLDYPGHYLRRIRSVSLTIPCVAGPYTSVNCTLTLLRSSVRHGNTLLSGVYARQDDDSRFKDSSDAIESIVTSSGQNDSGLFETNMRDERYLPFEGAGVISEWRIELPKVWKAFDYNTISDVILHVRYTAKEGGALLKQQAISERQTLVNEFVRAEEQQGFARLFSLRHDFPNAFHRLLNQSGPQQAIEFDITPQHFPYFLTDLWADGRVSLTQVMVYVQSTDTHPIDMSTRTLTVNHTNVSEGWSLVGKTALQQGRFLLSNSPIGRWSIQVTGNSFEREKLDDILLLLTYTISATK